MKNNQIRIEKDETVSDEELTKIAFKSMEQYDDVFKALVER